jgi:epoxyqueuosine reductase
MEKTEIIKIAEEFNFDLIGFSKVRELETETGRLSEWLSKGYHAGMAYMERNIEKKLNVKNILPEAESIISLGLNYYHDIEYGKGSNTGRISRYAAGNDYHEVIAGKIEKIIERISETYPDFRAKYYIDSGPVMDKAWAVNAGLGWMGKNSNIINGKIGSWFFIANIITNYVFDYDVPVNERCGSCTACIDACPTNAIFKPYVIDSNRCISYLTIENKGDIPGEFAGKFHSMIFGCDICQEVCPWNIKLAKESSEDEFTVLNKEIDLAGIGNMSSGEFKSIYKDTPIQRAKLKGIIRNAEFLKMK